MGQPTGHRYRLIRRPEIRAGRRRRGCRSRRHVARASPGGSLRRRRQAAISRRDRRTFSIASGRSGARGAPATAADAGELVEARGDIVGRFGGSLELIVRVLRRFVPDMQDLFAQLERQLGEGDLKAAPRPCIPSRAALPPLAPAPLAGRASELEQALRCAD